VPVADRLADRGLTIPPARVVPAGVRLTYRRLVRWQHVAYLAGHGPTHGDAWGSPLGQVGRDVSLAEAGADPDRSVPALFLAREGRHRTGQDLALDGGQTIV
jgi:hypothetical protein